MKIFQAPIAAEWTGWIIDNMRWMHRCAPSAGSRKGLAAMGLPQSVTAPTPLFAA